mmetsp:Transcript_11858/g.28151  ORF Transcript_11858/g.28151 Transcript_11858/m.28151 type:complete len:346 (+) Transcript_11858:918-1955(+)
MQGVTAGRRGLPPRVDDAPDEGALGSPKAGGRDHRQRLPSLRHPAGTDDEGAGADQVHRVDVWVERGALRVGALANREALPREPRLLHDALARDEDQVGGGLARLHHHDVPRHEQRAAADPLLAAADDLHRPFGPGKLREPLGVEVDAADHGQDGGPGDGEDEGGVGVVLPPAPYRDAEVLEGKVRVPHGAPQEGHQALGRDADLVPPVQDLPRAVERVRALIHPQADHVAGNLELRPERDWDVGHHVEDLVKGIQDKGAAPEVDELLVRQRAVGQPLAAELNKVVYRRLLEVRMLDGDVRCLRKGRPRRDIHGRAQPRAPQDQDVHQAHGQETNGMVNHDVPPP